MSKKAGVVLTIITIAALCLSVASLFVANKATDTKVSDQDIQYVMYLGTNDKDTNEPVYPPKKAKEITKEILISHFGGYTIQTANGGWIDDNDKVYQEYTLVIYLSDTTREEVHSAADELIKVFN